MRVTCLVVALGLGIVSSSARALDITTCGQTVPPGGVGTLQADLSGCTGGFGGAVNLEAHATLQMNGHTIANSTTGIFCSVAKSCSITGPGEISGGTAGILNNAYKGTTSITGINIHDTGLYGVYAPNSVRAQNLSVTHTTIASTNTYSVAISAGKFTGTNIAVSDNASWGLYIGSFTITGLTATGNGAFGLFGTNKRGRATLINSVVTGNNGFGAGIDLVTARRPQLLNTTCGLSAAAPVPPSFSPGPPWGVCTNDP